MVIYGTVHPLACENGWRPSTPICGFSTRPSAAADTWPPRGSSSSWSAVRAKRWNGVGLSSRPLPGRCVHLGPLGSGQEAKLLNNALFTAHLGLAADLFDLGREWGLDPEALGTLLAAGSGRSYGLEILAGSGHALDGVAPIVGPLLAKDVHILAELVGSQNSRVVDIATETIRAMGVEADGDVQAK